MDFRVSGSGTDLDFMSASCMSCALFLENYLQMVVFLLTNLRNWRGFVSERDAFLGAV